MRGKNWKRHLNSEQNIFEICFVDQGIDVSEAVSSAPCSGNQGSGEYFERAMGKVPCEVSKCRSSKALGESYLQ